LQRQGGRGLGHGVLNEDGEVRGLGLG
jgi:hypothetical protein